VIVPPTSKTTLCFSNDIYNDIWRYFSEIDSDSNEEINTHDILELFGYDEVGNTSTEDEDDEHNENIMVGHSENRDSTIDDNFLFYEDHLNEYNVE